MSLEPRALETDPVRAALRARVLAFLDRCAALGLDADLDRERDALLGEVAAWQAQHVTPFSRLCAARGARFDAGPDGWPALPTDLFRLARVSVFEAGADLRIFRTSGTTSGARGAHPFLDLALYDRAALLAAEHALFRTLPGTTPGAPLDLVLLALDPARHPDSSLGYMLGLFARAHRERDPGARFTWALADDRIDLEALLGALEAAEREGRAVALLGTSFAFVFAEDALSNRFATSRRFALPAGSRVMLTGGFKGRSREVSPSELAARVSERYGVPRAAIVSEYGMTELSSQLYGRGLLDTREGGHAPSPHESEPLWVPPWVRVVAVDPGSLAPLPDGARGILRIDDLANLDSVVSIQTADLGVIERAANGRPSVSLVGRDPTATPRGCSLAIEEALARPVTPR